MRVRGEYPISETPYSVRVSLPAPERVVGERLRDQLRTRGGRGDAAPCASRREPPPTPADGRSRRRRRRSTIRRSSRDSTRRRSRTSWCRCCATARTGRRRCSCSRSRWCAPAPAATTTASRRSASFLTDEVGRRRARSSRSTTSAVSRPRTCSRRAPWWRCSVRLAIALARRLRRRAGSPRLRHAGGVAAAAADGGQDRDAQAHARARRLLDPVGGCASVVARRRRRR